VTLETNTIFNKQRPAKAAQLRKTGIFYCFVDWNKAAILAK
jgi:hypothetical protein